MTLKTITGYILFIAGFVTLCGLGFWQYERAQWKDGIIQRLEAEYRKNPSENRLTTQNLNDPQELQFTSGYVRGRFLPDKVTYWPRVHDGAYGFERLQLFQPEQGPYVLVNLGWVPENPKTHEPVNNGTSLPEETTRIGGLLRDIDHGPFSLENNAGDNRWYRYNCEELERALDIAPLASKVLFVRDEELAYTGRLRAQNWFPRDKHTQYMMFWLTLAGLWALIFIIFRRTRGGHA